MISVIKKEAWHDTSIEKIMIEYNDVEVYVSTDFGMKKIVFKNYIAFDLLGQWDENIIESIYEEKKDVLITEALRKISQNNNINIKGGGTRDINAKWKCVCIKLIDGISIKIVCDGVELYKI